MGEVNDVNDHPSQETDFQIDAENSNVDGPDIIHDSTKTNDANAEQKETVNDDVDMEKADEATYASGHVNKDFDDRIVGETTIIDLGKDLSIQGGVEMNDATPMEGSSVIIGEQSIVQDGVTLIQDQLTMVDFYNDEDQVSNSE